MKRRLPGALWVAGALLVALFLVRSFVADVYRVESGSMEPFLHGGEAFGEWVLVDYGMPDDLERFDLVVTYEGSGKPVVKRVVGLPGETVQVSGGDLFVDGRRLPPEAPRPHPVTLFDEKLHDATEPFDWDAGSWLPPDATRTHWELRPDADPEQEHLLTWRSAFDDGYLLPDGTRVAGTRPVGDGLVSCELRADANGEDGLLWIDLRESGDRFRAVFEVVGRGSADGASGPRSGAWAVRFERHHPDFPVEVLAESRSTFELTEWTPVLFANVDNTLLLRVGGQPDLVATYAENRAPAGVPTVAGSTVGAQVELGGRNVGAGVRAIRIARDLHWIARGDFAVDRPLSLGPGECFLLGDNSARSLDGRIFGPTRLDAVLGRPQSVVWPRSRARGLRDGRIVLGRPTPVGPPGAQE